MSVENSDARWYAALVDIYGVARADELQPAVRALLDAHACDGAAGPKWDQRDAWLIAYPDQVRSDGEAPLATLDSFFQSHLSGAFNGLHVLPFFPSTSDEGFSISDYTAVDPSFGRWDDITTIGRHTRLMVDAVMNHSSIRSQQFEWWRESEPGYERFFRTADPNADLSETTRAREHPLLTPFETARGTEWVWTTFSADQADLNYGDERVLLSMLKVLLSYAQRGASILRLDAACFLWKEEGTSSIHLPQTHRIIQFLRACFDATYPNVLLISETNVPHDENISYLGDGTVPEADMVYRFTLPPLTLHAFDSGQARDLGRWLASAGGIPPQTTYLNFLASHDGVGLRPLEGIAADAAIDRLVAQAERYGGRANRRKRPDGASVAYELNATWYDLIRGSTTGDAAMARHVASHAIMFATAGVPAVYIHALLASENDASLMNTTGAARSINRTRLERSTLERMLADPRSRAARSLAAIKTMLEWRQSAPAFHPASEQIILDTRPEVLGIERRGASGTVARVFVNVTDTTVSIDHDPVERLRGFRFEETVSGFKLDPWGTAWLLDL
jgi:sucrose phosphorylase